MPSLTTLVASSLIATATPANQVPPVSITDPPKPVEQTVTISEPRFICTGCNENENLTLKFLQEKGIKDKNALATIMGNIKQESTFIPDICEGGARTGYSGCRAGGFGILQWTSSDRYAGLGRFAFRSGKNPSDLNTQLEYIFEEPQWMRIDDKMKIPGKSIDRYMAYAYSWIGWGIHGSRTSYARDYAQRLTPES